MSHRSIKMRYLALEETSHKQTFILVAKQNVRRVFPAQNKWKIFFARIKFHIFWRYCTLGQLRKTSSWFKKHVFTISIASLLYTLFSTIQHFLKIQYSEREFETKVKKRNIWVKTNSVAIRLGCALNARIDPNFLRNAWARGFREPCAMCIRITKLARVLSPNIW